MYWLVILPQDTFVSQLGLLTDYLASFPASQFLLSLCDRGLQAVETVVQVCSQA